MRQPPSSPLQTFSLNVIAENLKLNTLQGIAIVQDSIIVPTMDGEILRVEMDGKISVLTNLLQRDLGIPFAIVANGPDSVVVTTSTYDPLHFLVRVGLDGSVNTLCDLSEFNTPMGAPFGVAIEGQNYLLAGSKDVVTDQGVLYRVTAQGKVEELVSLAEFGDPLELLSQQDQVILSMRTGDVLMVQGKAISLLTNLEQLGLGVAFSIALHNEDYILTTNRRKILKINSATGQVSVLYDLMPNKVGVPAGLAVWRDRLIISTDGGLLLELRS
jgi:hypothetical protein